MAHTHRHQGDTKTYRGLANYKERVQSFNGTVRNLCEYARVQLELDVSGSRSGRDIIAARVETLHKAIDTLNAMV
jgi:hypothetical protein